MKSLNVCVDCKEISVNFDTVYVSKPTWGNHNLIFKNSNYQNINSYRQVDTVKYFENTKILYFSYWDPVGCRVDIEGLCADIEAAPEK